MTEADIKRQLFEEKLAKEQDERQQKKKIVIKQKKEEDVRFLLQNNYFNTQLTCSLIGNSYAIQ